MKFELLKEVIEKIKSAKIAVIGDFCLDVYWFIDESKSEISIETGLPTHTVKSQRYSLGGAGNLANNIASLGVGEVRAIGVTGNDLFGRELLRIMDQSGIYTGNMLVQKENWATHVYAKPYIGDDELNRIDFGNFNRLSPETENRIMEVMLTQVKEVDVVVINQQVISGIHQPGLRERMVRLIADHPDKIFIADSRDFNGAFTGAYLKMNDIEAAKLAGLIKDSDEGVTYADACKAAELINKKTTKPVFVTCGSKGSIAVDDSGLMEIPGLMLLSKLDTVGAGDSYLAGAASALAAGYALQTAAELGSLVAGVTVQKLFQTGTASPEEVLEIGKDPDLVYKPELAEDIRKANYLNETEIEVVNEWPEESNFKYAVFDHDGTISTLREGWEKIMEPMMIKAILGDRFHSVDQKTLSDVRNRVVELIDKTTGVQTLAQMKHLIELIREFGFVEEEKILDMHGYKKVYNEELLAMVNKRVRKFQNGELTIDDLTIKNAVPVLRAMHKAGIKLYLASGTDRQDVINEARLLGYDHFFNGGIYGAVGDIKKEAKRIVIDMILGSIEDSGETILTFGDGPVEIRETRKMGGFTIGIASDEVKRFGLNEKKRTRLVKAGADIILPDFSQFTKVSHLLKIQISHATS